MHLLMLSRALPSRAYAEVQIVAWVRGSRANRAMSMWACRVSVGDCGRIMERERVTRPRRCQAAAYQRGEN